MHVWPAMGVPGLDNGTLALTPLRAIQDLAASVYSSVK